MSDQEKKISDINFLLNVVFKLDDQGYSLDEIDDMFKNYKFRERYYKDRNIYRKMKISDVAMEIVVNYKENENDK